MNPAAPKNPQTQSLPPLQDNGHQTYHEENELVVMRNHQERFWHAHIITDHRVQPIYLDAQGNPTLDSTRTTGAWRVLANENFDHVLTEARKVWPPKH